MQVRNSYLREYPAGENTPAMIRIYNENTFNNIFVKSKEREDSVWVRLKNYLGSKGFKGIGWGIEKTKIEKIVGLE